MAQVSGLTSGVHAQVPHTRGASPLYSLILSGLWRCPGCAGNPGVLSTQSPQELQIGGGCPGSPPQPWIHGWLGPGERRHQPRS